MTRIEARKWNGIFHREGMLPVIKRKIEAAQAGSTLLVDFEGANVTPEQVRFLMAGFPVHRVRFIGHPETLPHPLPGTEASRPHEAPTGEEPPHQEPPGQ